MKLTRFKLLWLDFILLTLVFWVVNIAKRGSFDLPEGYGLLLGLVALKRSGFGGKLEQTSTCVRYHSCFRYFDRVEYLPLSNQGALPDR